MREIDKSEAQMTGDRRGSTRHAPWLGAGGSAAVSRMQLAIGTTILAISLLFTSAFAQADTIEALKQRKSIILGVRADQPPFSQIGKDGKPDGYAVALCLEIVKTLRDTQNMPELGVSYVTVSADSRFDDLASGKIDMLCEGTSQTIQRMQQFDFTLQIWVSGTGLMTRSDTDIANMRDLEGERIGVVGNTSTEAMLRATLHRLLITSEVVTFESHLSALHALEDKKIEAYFADRDTLIVLREQSKEPDKIRVADESLSLEPFAFALRQNDDRLRVIANLALSRLYRSGKAQQLFHVYFPNAEPSALLKALFILQAIPEI
jgi:polar amino acid transport system substrate-binding protein/glutamate/aspartate transport system substrate-binding protein